MYRPLGEPTEWPEPQVVLEADPQDPPTDDLYTNGYSRYPGGGPFHLMFPAVYYRTRDVLDVHLAVSRDGVLWHRPERTPIIPMGPAASPQAELADAAPRLVGDHDQQQGQFPGDLMARQPSVMIPG